MEVIIHPHAYIHGLSEEAIRCAFITGFDAKRVRSRDRDTLPPRWGIIGYDNAGRNIELVATPLASGDVLIFHARTLTKGFAEEMRKARKI